MTYHNIRTPAGRLAAYKEEAANPKYVRPLTWRDTRKWLKPDFLREPSLTRSADGKMIFIDHLDSFAGGDWADAAECYEAHMDYTGWYAGNFQDNLVKPAYVVIRTSHRTDEDGGHFVYMPASYHTDWDGATVYNEFYDNRIDAISAADGYAEKLAEQCREHDAKYQAEAEIKNLKEELHTLNRKTLDLVREVKENNRILPQTVCDLIREHIDKTVERRTEIFDRIAALQNDYWLAVE